MGYGRHLRQRGGASHFRRAIPKDIATRFGRREIVRSVGALPAFERHSLCRRFGLACDEVFRIVRSQTTLSRAEIDRLVTVYIDGVARRDREYESWNPRRPADEGEFRRQSQIEIYAGLARSVMDGRRTRAGVVTAEVLAATAQEAGIDIESDLDAHLAEDALTEALARYYEQRVEDLRREGEVGASNGFDRFLKRLLGDWAPQERHAPEHGPGGHVLRPSYPDAHEGVSGHASAPADVKLDPNGTADPIGQVLEEGARAEERAVATSTPSEDTFGKCWDEFVETKIAVREEWKPSRRPELLSTRRLWIWIVGDLPVSVCTSDHIRKFHDTYLLLPEDYSRLRKSKKVALSPADVIGAAKLREENEAKRKRAAPKPYKRVNAKTFNKHLGNLKSFFTWQPVAKLRPAGEADPTQGFHIAVDKSTAAVRAERHMAPVEAIRQLFKSPYWTGRASDYFLTEPGDVIVRDAMYWIPLIVAFHGLRREEIAQLRVRHVKWELVGKTESKRRVWYFDLTASDLDLKEPDKGSPRRVPFHRQFEKLGFLEDKIVGRTSTTNCCSTNSQTRTRIRHSAFPSASASGITSTNSLFPTRPSTRF